MASRLHEFAENSRIFSYLPRRKPGSCNFFSLVERPVRPLLASSKLRLSFKNEGKLYETDTWNIAERRSWTQTTHWTLVLRARQTHPIHQRRRRFRISARRTGRRCMPFCDTAVTLPPEAQDLVQGSRPSAGTKHVEPGRSHEKAACALSLLGSLQNFLFNEHDRAHALKRGGNRQIVSIDEHLPEVEASMMDTAYASDSRSYDLIWASPSNPPGIHLQTEFESEGKAESLEVLRPLRCRWQGRRR